MDGQLVMLGYDIAACTPASYQRRSLQPVSYTHLSLQTGLDFIHLANPLTVDVLGDILLEFRVFNVFGTVSYTHLDVYKRQVHPDRRNIS